MTPCSWEGCPNPAAYVVTFVGQPGHVHDCPAHTAVLRRATDVETARSMPCGICGTATPSWVAVPDRPKPTE